MSNFNKLIKPLLLVLLLGAGMQLHAQTIKIGEVNSYKAHANFLGPYKKGMDLALEEINASGGLLGKKVEIISRDDNANPGDAVRAAEESRISRRRKKSFSSLRSP